jgi:hypothetical protein
MAKDATLRLGDFQGSWKLRREINDHLNGVRSELIGGATFTPENGGLKCVETGLLTVTGQKPMQANRTYLWRRRGSDIDVQFENGDPFHQFHPLLDTVTAAHFCAPDQYDVTYDFSGWPNWTGEWRVKGPRKDYQMVSHFIR